MPESASTAAEVAEGEAASPPPKTLREEILALYEKRTRTEAKLKEAMDLLATTPAGLHGALIDAEGFPRADCDLYMVRTARNTVACSRTDLREIEEALYEKLGQLHEESREEAAAQMSADTEARRQGKQEAEARDKHTRAVQRVSKLAPLLTVASVEFGSPAAEAGMTRGSIVLQFGDLNADCIRERGLGSIATVTKEHEGALLSVWVREPFAQEPKELFITPQTWSGRGLLGCALDPIQ